MVELRWSFARYAFSLVTRFRSLRFFAPTRFFSLITLFRSSRDFAHYAISLFTLCPHYAISLFMFFRPLRFFAYYAISLMTRFRFLSVLYRADFYIGPAPVDPESESGWETIGCLTAPRFDVRDPRLAHRIKSGILLPDVFFRSPFGGSLPLPLFTTTPRLKGGSRAIMLDLCWLCPASSFRFNLVSQE
jgi:hypothetical protein